MYYPLTHLGWSRLWKRGTRICRTVFGGRPWRLPTIADQPQCSFFWNRRAKKIFVKCGQFVVNCVSHFHV